MSTGSKDYGVTFDVGAKGTLQPPVQSGAEFVTNYWAGSGGIVAAAPWKAHLRMVYTSTPTEHGIAGATCAHCSITGDVSERPSTVETFTAHISEWVSTFDLDRPPIYIVVNAAPDASLGEVHPEDTIGNAGYLAVLWLKEFFGTSQKAAMDYAGVPEATFYVWKNNPSSSVRSPGARRALKLRASIEVAIARMGADPVRRFIKVGHPSIEERLRESRGVPWERAVTEIAEFGTYKPPAPLPRISEPSEYLRRVREIEDGAIDTPSGTGARLLSESEIRDAEQEGW
jgi:hypothetical protein